MIGLDRSFWVDSSMLPRWLPLLRAEIPKIIESSSSEVEVLLSGKPSLACHYLADE